MLIDPTDFSLDELADLARVSARTVRYYVYQGLLPGAGSRGPKTRYTQGHLARLRLIKRLQEEHWPLAKIRDLLLRSSDEDVEMLLADGPREAAASPLLDYLSSIPGRTAEGYPRAKWTPPPAPSAPPASLFDRVEVVRPEPPRATSMRRTAEPQRATYERIQLTPNLELHLIHPLTPEEARLAERLVSLARKHEATVSTPEPEAE